MLMLDKNKFPAHLFSITHLFFFSIATKAVDHIATWCIVHVCTFQPINGISVLYDLPSALVTSLLVLGNNNIVNLEINVRLVCLNTLPSESLNTQRFFFYISQIACMENALDVILIRYGICEELLKIFDKSINCFPTWPHGNWAMPPFDINH